MFAPSRCYLLKPMEFKVQLRCCRLGRNNCKQCYTGKRVFQRVMESRLNISQLDQLLLRMQQWLLLRYMSILIESSIANLEGTAVEVRQTGGFTDKVGLVDRTIVVTGIPYGADEKVLFKHYSHLVLVGHFFARIFRLLKEGW